MLFSSWLRPRNARLQSQSTQRSRLFRRPCLERLEDRLAPAIQSVTNTLDTGLGSLREAITRANLDPDPDTIVFNIPADDARHFYYKDDGLAGHVTSDSAHLGVTNEANDANIPAAGSDAIDPDWLHSWWTITPGQPLPTLLAGRGPAVIDGTTQSGWVANTQAEGLDTVLRIELTGGRGSLGQQLQSSLRVEADDCTVKGLIINEAGNTGFQLIQLVGTQRCTVAGNFIGTDPSGLLDRVSGNDFGVYILGNGGADPAMANTVGGLTPAARNLISGPSIGVYISSGPNNQVVGNLIGTDRTRRTRLDTLGNSAGIYISDGASNLIGGDTVAARNVISGHSTGIFIRGNNNVVQGNYLGVDATGLAAVPNSIGINLESGSGSTIGGTTAGAGNVIAFSVGVGVSVYPAVQNAAILGNSIYASGGLGIDLFRTGEVNGVTPNDESSSPYDTDTGANSLQNYPMLTVITNLGGSLRIAGTLKSKEVNTEYRLEFFTNPAQELPTHHGEGRTFLGFVDVRTDGTGLADFRGGNALTLTATLQGTNYITATASPITLDDDNDPATPLIPTSTSEFSAEIDVVGTTNGDPVALDDTAATDEDVPLDIPVSDILANDTDPDGDALTVTVQSATHGTATYNDNGTPADTSDDFIRFVPEKDYHGPATITYKVDDGLSADTAVIGVTINPVNDRPEAQDATYETSSGLVLGNQIEIDLRTLVSDIETPNAGLVYTIVTPPNDVAFPVPATGFLKSITPRGGFQGVITFTYQVTDQGDGPSPALSSAVRTVTITVSPRMPDLRVFLTDSPDPAVQGDDMAYYIRVENHGPVAAENVRVRFQLPSEIVRLIRSPAMPLSQVLFIRPQVVPYFVLPNLPHAGTWSQINDVELEFQLGLPLRPISEGDVATMAVFARPTVMGKTITARATASSAVPDANPADNQATAMTYVNGRVADLGITITATPNRVLTGAVLTYQVKVVNNGPQDAHHVATKVKLPIFGTRPLLTEVVFAGPGDLPTLDRPQAGIWKLDTLARGATATLTIEGRVLPLAAGRTLSNSVAVSADESDPVRGNNSALASVAARAPSADVCVTTTISPNPAVPDDPVTFEVRVVNNGPDEAHDVTIEDVLPHDAAGKFLRDVNRTYTQGIVVDDLAHHKLTWSVGTLAQGEAATLTIHGVVLLRAGGRTLSNVATATAEESDPVPANNKVVAALQVLQAPDLSVSMTASANPVKVNAPLTYTIKVKNNGPVATTGVKLTVDLPAGVTFVSVTPNQGAVGPTPGSLVGPTNGTLWVSLGQLNVGGETTVLVKVIPRAVAQLVTTASVASNRPDSNLSNNSVTLATAAGPKIELIQNGSFEVLQPGAVNPWTVTGGASTGLGRLTLRPDRGHQQTGEQTVTLPAQLNRVILMFNLTVLQPDAGNLLFVEIVFPGNIAFPLLAVPAYSPNGPSPNGPYTLIVPGLPGQTMGVRVRAVTSSEFDINFTTFKIDDVSLCVE